MLKLDQTNLIKVCTINKRMAKQIEMATNVAIPPATSSPRLAIFEALRDNTLRKPLGWAIARYIFPSAQLGTRIWLVEFEERLYWYPAPHTYAMWKDNTSIPQLFV